MTYEKMKLKVISMSARASVLADQNKTLANDLDKHLEELAKSAKLNKEAKGENITKVKT